MTGDARGNVPGYADELEVIIAVVDGIDAGKRRELGWNLFWIGWNGDHLRLGQAFQSSGEGRRGPKSGGAEGFEEKGGEGEGRSEMGVE